jgi:myo-inositol-1(or 4)-monophosphatase
MLGSAAESLLLVAQGGVDVYFEDGIMLWDVAAGLAIVEGAGGAIEIEQGANWSCRIWSSNGMLRNPSQAVRLR